MLYRDERRTVRGVYNREYEFTAKRHVQVHADSLYDLMQWLGKEPKRWPREESRVEGDKKWSLGASWADTETMVREGWREGVERMEAKLSAIIPATGRTNRWGYAPHGSSVNIGRFVRDHPKPMRNRRRRDQGSQKVLHLVVNGSASCMVSADQMANYGVALVGLIQRLEQTGRRVHLDVCFVSKLEGDVRASVGWNVKTASQYLDINAVAFSIGHPVAFRRLGFAMLERMPKEAFCYGYGYCADIQPDDLVQPVHGAMLVDGVNHNPSRCNTPQDALRLAIEQVNKAAVLAGHATPDSPLIEEDEFLIAA